MLQTHRSDIEHNSDDFFRLEVARDIALMSVNLSERTLSVENSKVSAMQSADRITMAFAKRGELMKLSKNRRPN